MICPKCNNEIPDNSTFCNHCGKTVIAPVIQKAEQPYNANNTTVLSETTTSEPTNEQTLPVRKGLNKIILIGIAIITVLVISIVIFWGYRRFKQRTFDFSSIDVVRYLNKSTLSLHMDDITDKGTVVEPSFGNTTVTTWIDNSGEEDSNKCISFCSDHNAKKYCENFEPSSHRLQYGNIVLELSSKIEDDSFSDYKNEMANLVKDKDSAYTHERMMQNLPSPFADFNSFMEKTQKTTTAFSKYCTFKEQTLDSISNDGIYKNFYTFGEYNILKV